MTTLLEIADELTAELQGLRFSPPVAYVYNPLEYAREPYRRYLERFGSEPREVLLVGMNPGPWGMAQTGIPFGAVEAVRGWLGLGGEVGKPAEEHPDRPVLGFDCPRNEVSGDRLWSWAEERFGTPERFFERFFVHNYCPLLFLEEGGRNLTPDKLRADERRALVEPCDRALRRTAEVLGVRRAIGVGAWAERRARAALDDLDLEIGRVLHPSPASPRANRGWAEQATAELREQGGGGLAVCSSFVFETVSARLSRPPACTNPSPPGAPLPGRRWRVDCGAPGRERGRGRGGR